MKAGTMEKTNEIKEKYYSPNEPEDNSPPTTRDRLRIDIPYFQVPNEIFDLAKDIYHLAVLTYLLRCGNNASVAFPSFNTIAAKCHISRRKAIYVVQELVSQGFIIKESNRDKWKSNTYILTLPSAQHAPPSAPGAPPSAQHAPYKEPFIKNYDKYYSDIYSSSSSSLNTEIPKKSKKELFDEFCRQGKQPIEEVEKELVAAG